MGCFNHKANFSQLPIVMGDRIVVLIGVRPTTDTLSVDGFAPGNSFTPISVAIRGSYNDYGGIENVDMTPGVEALESFFGMGVEDIVNYAERMTCGCGDQVEEEHKKVMDVLSKLETFKAYSKRNLKVTYIMEHESIFDGLVSMANLPAKDYNYWCLPHYFLEGLGYEKHVEGKDGYYDVITWTHKTLPKLKESCYVWKENDFGDYSKTRHTFASFCEYIGCEVPEKYNESYYEMCFLRDIEKIAKKKTEIESLSEKPDDDFSFRRYFVPYGLFKTNSSSRGINSLKLISLGTDNAHLDVKYMKEVVEIAALYEAMESLQMTWGNTNYYRQDVSYDIHINFLEKCLALAKDKQKNEETEDE